jgi:hypothetical protein
LSGFEPDLENVDMEISDVEEDNLILVSTIPVHEVLPVSEAVLIHYFYLQDVMVPVDMDISEDEGLVSYCMNEDLKMRVIK